MRINGRELNKKTPGRNLRATLKRLGLERPGLGWYEATRHTFASQWVLSGGSIEKLKEILGHSVVVTERYTHAPPTRALRGPGALHHPTGAQPRGGPLPVPIGQSLGSGNREPPRNPAILKTKDRSGPVSRVLCPLAGAA